MKKIFLFLGGLVLGGLLVGLYFNNTQQIKEKRTEKPTLEVEKEVVNKSVSKANIQIEYKTETSPDGLYSVTIADAGCCSSEQQEKEFIRVIHNETGEERLKLTINEIEGISTNENIISWSVNEKTLWIQVNSIYTILAFYKIDLETWGLEKYDFKIPISSEAKFNPHNGIVLYEDRPMWQDPPPQEEIDNSSCKMATYNLRTKEVKVLEEVKPATAINCFNYEWDTSSKNILRFSRPNEKLKDYIFNDSE